MLHARLLPIGHLVARGGSGFIAGRSMTSNAERRQPSSFWNGRRVELLEQLRDRGVELVQAEEASVAQARQDPALREQHARLDFRLVPRLPRARGDDRYVS